MYQHEILVHFLQHRRVHFNWVITLHDCRFVTYLPGLCDWFVYLGFIRKYGYAGVPIYSITFEYNEKRKELL